MSCREGNWEADDQSAGEQQERFTKNKPEQSWRPRSEGKANADLVGSARYRVRDKAVDADGCED